MSRAASETALAWLTLVAAILHFSGETYYALTIGEPLTSLLSDYISNALMLLAAWRSLSIRPRSAAGLLSAAWGFALCLAYGTTFGRLELLWSGQAPIHGEPSVVVSILLVAFALAAAIFVWALALAWRQTRPA